jgi:diguanylate cyclase (GGDEF)-like protein
MGMKKILIIQAQQCLYRTLVSQITAVTNLHVDVVETLQDASIMIEKNHYFLMLLDVDLPDSSSQEVRDFLLQKEIPAIIMADVIYDDFKMQLQRSLVVDYVIKESPEVITHIVKSVNRIYRNLSTKVLVVDDAASDRALISMLAKHQLYQVCEVSNGEEAIKILERDSQIKIIVADIHMPKLDGMKLLKFIRERKLQNELAILGVSSDTESLIRFMKLGANDFVIKPFTKREFITRLNHLADVYEHIKELDELSSRDYLTGLRSRKYFFEEATPYVYQAYKSKEPCAVAMIDIDNFKRINDSYGHDIGDVVIQRLAKVLHAGLKGSDIVARYGGEEFCVLLRDTKPEDAKVVFENLRKKVEKEVVHVMGIPYGVDVTFSVSIGLNTQPQYSLEKMLIEADFLLYEAKKMGKNRVVSKPIFKLAELV